MTFVSWVGCAAIAGGPARGTGRLLHFYGGVRAHDSFAQMNLSPCAMPQRFQHDGATDNKAVSAEAVRRYQCASLSQGRLEGTEAFGLYLTEIASNVLAISQQSALLLQAVSERAVLLPADMAEEAEDAVSATSQTPGEAGQCHQAPGPAENCDTSVSAA